MLDRICFRKKLAEVQCKDYFLFVCFGRIFFQGAFIGQSDAFMWPGIKVSRHGVASKKFSFSMFILCRDSGGLSEKLFEMYFHLSTYEMKTPKIW